MLHALAKKGHYNKWFDRQAAQILRGPYAGRVAMSKYIVRTYKIRHVVWVEVDGTPVAATALICMAPGSYRLFGMATDPAHRRKGYGSQVLRRAMQAVPPGSTIELGVDAGAPEWITDWYRKERFEVTATRKNDAITMSAVTQ